MQHSVKQDKKNLRTEMINKRFQLDNAYKTNYDRIICEILKDTIIKHNHQVIHLYIPIAGEIDIKPLINYLLDSNRTVICPKALPNRILENRILLNLENLEIGIKGTLHPSNKEIYNGEIEFCIVPGLAFDQDNYRLGYGGAYYDTFINKNRSMSTIGIFYPFQKVTKIPIEYHDMKLDEVLIIKT